MKAYRSDRVENKIKRSALDAEKKRLANNLSSEKAESVSEDETLPLLAEGDPPRSEAEAKEVLLEWVAEPTTLEYALDSLNKTYATELEVTGDEVQMFLDSYQDSAVDGYEGYGAESDYQLPEEAGEGGDLTYGGDDDNRKKKNEADEKGVKYEKDKGEVPDDQEDALVSGSGSTTEASSSAKLENVAEGSGADTEEGKGMALFRTGKLTEKQASDFIKAEAEVDGLDFWEMPVPGREVNIAVPKDKVEELEEFAKKCGVEIRKTVEDLTDFIKRSSALKSMSNRFKQSDRYKFNWEDYHGYDLFVEFMTAEAQLQHYIKTYSIGKSYDKKETNVIAITKAGKGKPNIWLEAGIHAREWVAPAVAAFVIRQLTETSEASKYLDKANFYVLPVANPDGYEHSRKSTDTRLWRKNRRKVQGSSCYGVDLNRNFGHKFGLTGISHDPCKETYLGGSAFSEPETNNIKRFFESLRPVPLLAMSVHSALNAMMYGRSYSKKVFVENKAETVSACEAMIDALNKVNKQNFTCMHSPDLYPTGGDASDWYYEQGSRFVYTIELRDNGWSFLLPPKQILPSGEEFWAGFKVLLDKILADGGKSLKESKKAGNSGGESGSGKGSGGGGGGKMGAGGMAQVEAGIAGRSDWGGVGGDNKAKAPEKEPREAQSDRVVEEEYEHGSGGEASPEEEEEEEEEEDEGDEDSEDRALNDDSAEEMEEQDSEEEEREESEEEEEKKEDEEMHGLADKDEDKKEEDEREEEEREVDEVAKLMEEEEEDVKNLKRQRLYRTEPLATEEQVSALNALRMENPLDFDFWSFPSLGRPSRIMVERGSGERDLLRQLRGIRVNATRVTRNVHRLVSRVNPARERRLFLRSGGRRDRMDWRHYHGYGAIVEFMRGLARRDREVYIDCRLTICVHLICDANGGGFRFS